MRLTPPFAATLAIVTWGLPLHAADASRDTPPVPQVEPGLRSPVRVTAGAANQFLGVPSPDGRRVIFASDERATTEVYVQDLEGGGPRLLFDREADATWPRPSPDGRRVLYLSFRDDASGDACVFDPDTGEHTCLTGPETADVQALWFPDGTVGVVQRDALHGDFRLVRLPAGGGAATVVVDRSLSSPAVSPDGRFLASVPLEKVLPAVGVSFAPRTGTSLEFRTLDGTDAPRPWRPDLPGATGFPAFSVDGRWLYFAQYRNDTNGDGSIDGADNGVVFRVAFDTRAGRPEAGAVPEQLTSAAWNCQYPLAAPEALFVTCSHEGSLDVYHLPLDGAVPPGWDLARLDAETRASRSPWERLLLMARALAKETDPAARGPRLRSIAFAEADAGDLSSADHHARTLRREAGAGPGASEADALLELVDHRRDEQRFLRGAMPQERFLGLARSRAERMRSLSLQFPEAAPLARLARSEILDAAGDEAGAREAFDAVPPASLGDADRVRLYARRAVEILRADPDRTRLLQVLAALSAHPALDATDRLAFAERYTTLLLQGLPAARRATALARALADALPGSDLAFRLDLETRLAPLGHADPDAVRKAVFDLYRGTSDPDRQEALSLATARRAAALDADAVTYNFVNTWASGVRRASPSRKKAEALYRAVVLDRAWSDLAGGNAPDARGRFREASQQTDALEAHEGFVEARLAEGKDDFEALYASRDRSDPDDPSVAFVRAYRIARDVPATADPAAALAAIDRADALARTTARQRPNTWEVHLLRGFLAHRRHLATGDSGAAVDASAEYALALDLARDSPRARATILLQAGLLQASLGNTASALRLLDDRARLPFASPAAELSFRLARARCLFLSDRDGEAADEAERALARVDGTAALASHRLRALDHAALYALAAGRADVAAKRYAELRPALAASLPPESPSASLALARLDLVEGAALLAAGRASEASEALARARTAFSAMGPLPPAAPAFPGRASVPRPFDRLDALVLSTALEARALDAAGRLPEAATRVDEVVRLRTERLASRDLDEDVLALAEAEYHRAETAWHRGDRPAFAAHARTSLARAREYADRTGTAFPVAETRALAGLAEACLLHGLPPKEAGDGIGTALDRAHAFLATHRSAPRDAERFRLGILTALWHLRHGDPPPDR